jgi:PAS domain S-box-containing protein
MSAVCASFLHDIEQYVKNRAYTERINLVIADGVKVFSKLPYDNISSFYLLNDTSFEFEQNLCLPEEFGDSMETIYSDFIDNGNIGKVLESGKIHLYSLQNEPIKSFTTALVIPLKASWGVLGLVLILLKCDESDFDIDLLKLCSLHAGLFAGSLENTKLFINLNRSKLILEQKVAERTMDLAKSRRELRTIFDSVHSGIMVIDADTDYIIRINPVGETMIGLPENEILGSKREKFLSTVHFSGDARNSFTNFESELKTNKKTLPILRTISSINLGTQKFFIESFVDISDRKQRENELRKSNEILELKVEERTEDLQLLIHKLKEEIRIRERAESEARKMLAAEKELNEMKSKFVSMVSHEFRTPLTIIKSAAQLLDKFFVRLSEEEKKDYLSRIMKTVDIMTDLIENVIYIGKDEQNKHIRLSKIKLKDFISMLVNDLKLTLGKGRTVNIKISTEEDYLNTDDKLLRLILLNLITNALKYSDETKHVNIDAAVFRDIAVISVEDFGIGIPEDEQEKIFDLFYRADNVGTISGTGLGMAVVLQSIKQLNGKIEVKSRKNIGSTFTFRIPNNL